MRVLESLARGAPLEGRTDLFITPGFEFRRVDALLTNFHLPRSTLLALVMAFAGVEETRRLYRLAIEERYRFYSFGDAMLPVSDLSASTLGATDGAARTGVLRTAHGELRTPAFMPVGTKATVKAVDPDELRAARRRDPALQHLPPALPPGRRPDRRARRPAPLHGLGRADPHRLGRLPGLLAARHDPPRDDDGVTFRSVYDGDEARFTPELAARIQAQLGSDIAMCLDVVPPPDAPRSELEDAVRRHDPLGRSASSRPNARRASCCSGSPRAAPIPSCGAAASRRSSELGFDGHALGGLAIGESKEQMLGDDGVGVGAAPARASALLHGHRRPGRHPRGDRARDRHVRLRAADPQRAHGLGADLGGPART